MPTLLERKVRLLVPLAPRPRPRSGAARRRPGERDRVGQGAPRQARRLRAGGHRRRPRHSPGPPARSPTSSAPYEREKRKRGPRRLRRPHHRLRRRARARRRVRGRAALALPPPVRRRVPGRQPRAVPAAARVARRPHRPLRRRRRRPGDLRLRRRRPHLPHAVHRALPARAVPRVGVVRLGRNYRSTPQVVRQPGAVLGPPGRRRTAEAARPDGPLPSSEYDDEDDEARGVAHARARRARARRAVVARSPCSTGSTRSRRCSRRPSAASGSRSVCEAAAASSTGPRCRSRSTTCRSRRATAPSRTFAEHLTDLAADADGSRRGAPRARRRRRAPRPRVPRGRGGPELAAGSGSVDGFLAFLRPRCATTTPAARGRRRRAAHVPPRQGPRVRHGVRHRARARPRADLPRQDHRRARRGAAAPLRRAEPRRARAALSWAAERTVGGRVANRTASPWLARVERAHRRAPTPTPPSIASTSAHGSPDARAHVSKQQSAKREVPEADAPLYEALVEWRRRLSHASGAPAYVVFHDTTLVAIADGRPRTRVALLDGPGHRAGQGRALRRRGARPRRRARHRPADPAAH